ncbi:hypothetical protein GCM10009111_21270 [Colwellia asteriadis]|uniref:Uncharacterized protein n=1 Tax=Colwellia asteriadis TaxID=517723 RepID=A0ABN1L8H3_9GAMM
MQPIEAPAPNNRTNLPFNNAFFICGFNFHSLLNKYTRKFDRVITAYYRDFSVMSVPYSYLIDINIP